MMIAETFLLCKQNLDDSSVFLKLLIEERRILKQALGLESAD
jgi:hypothetical protein